VDLDVDLDLDLDLDPESPPLRGGGCRPAAMNGARATDRRAEPG
jgi:hypothetical protein